MSLPNFSRRAEGAPTSRVGVPEGKTSSSSLGLTPVESYDGWVTVMDTELSPDRWTEWFDSKKYAKWRAWYADDVEAEVGGKTKRVSPNENFGPNKTVRFRGSGHLTIKALPW